MKRNLLLILLCLLTMSLSAQKVYHYKKVATIDDNGVKQSPRSANTSANYISSSNTLYRDIFASTIHLIFTSSGVQFCNEYGEPLEDIWQGERLTNPKYSPAWNDKKAKASGKVNFCAFVKRENDVWTYSGSMTYEEEVYMYCPSLVYGGGHNDWVWSATGKISRTLYVPQGMQKINIYTTYHRGDKYVNYPSDHKLYDVYELYDSDEVGSIQKPQKFDPTNPGKVY